MYLTKPMHPRFSQTCSYSMIIIYQNLSISVSLACACIIIQMYRYQSLFNSVYLWSLLTSRFLSDVGGNVWWRFHELPQPRWSCHRGRPVHWSSSREIQSLQTPTTNTYSTLLYLYVNVQDYTNNNNRYKCKCIQ